MTVMLEEEVALALSPILDSGWADPMVNDLLGLALGIPSKKAPDFSTSVSSQKLILRVSTKSGKSLFRWRVGPVGGNNDP